LQDKKIKLDSNAAITSVTKQIHYASKRKQEPPLKMPFQLPINFPDNIKDGLANEHLVGKPRSKFVTKIAEALFVRKVIRQVKNTGMLLEKSLRNGLFLRRKLEESVVILTIVFFI